MPKKTARISKRVQRISGKQSAAAKVEEYRGRVEDLYQAVESWAADWNANVRRAPIEVTEQAPGTYTMEAVDIEVPGLKRPVRLRPVGCYIAGAEGRVEVESAAGHEALVYLSEGGPAMTVHLTDAEGRPLEKPKTRRLRKETAPGWVWVQNRFLGLFPTVNDDLMRRMVEVLGR